MIMNLSRSFCFSKEKDAYDVEYTFKKKAHTEEGLWLILTVSVNRAGKRTYTIGKPTSVLYQSNEIIEKLIEAEVLSLTQDPSKIYTVA